MKTSQNLPFQAKIPDEIDQKIVHILIQTPAITDQELANLIQISLRTISRRRNSESVKNLLKDRLSIPAHEIRRLVVKSLERLDQSLDSPDPRIRFSAAATVAKLGSQFIDTAVAKNAGDENGNVVYKTCWGDMGEE